MTVEKVPLVHVIHEALDLLDIVIRESGSDAVRERAVWARNDAVKAAALLGSPRFTAKSA